MSSPMLLILWWLTMAQRVVAAGKVALLIVDVQYCFLSGGSLAVQQGDDVIPIINRLREARKELWDVVVLSQDWHCKDHVSFASQHSGYQQFDAKELFYDKNGGLCTEEGITNSYSVNCKDAEVTSLNQTLWPDHCVMYTKGANVTSQLTKQPGDIYIHKGYNCEVDSYSVFYDNGRYKKTELNTILQNHNVTSVYITGLATDFCVKDSAIDAMQLGYRTHVIMDATRPVYPDTMNDVQMTLQNHGITILQSEDLLDDAASNSRMPHVNQVVLLSLLMMTLHNAQIMSRYCVF